MNTKYNISEETYCGINAFITDIEHDNQLNEKRTPEELKEDLEIALSLLQEVIDDCDYFRRK